MSRPVATTITFLISALAHELVMGCITRKFRGYGFFAMMLQMPIVMVQRSKWVRGRTLLNNVLFWCSMILGLSMVSRVNNIYTAGADDYSDVRTVCPGVDVEV
jgi:sterol O-acyltransferase